MTKKKQAVATTHVWAGAAASEPDGDSDSGRMGETMNSCVSNNASTSMGGRMEPPVMYGVPGGCGWNVHSREKPMPQRGQTQCMHVLSDWVWLC
jgi:hypothetical protein